jgi:hypothetical protein
MIFVSASALLREHPGHSGYPAMQAGHGWSASRFAKVFAPGETRSFRPWLASEIIVLRTTHGRLSPVIKIHA